jgi:aminocarboxymuconate-semialdehyde decarboxylase
MNQSARLACSGSGRMRLAISLCCLPLADTEAALTELDRVRSHPLFSGVAMGSSIERVPLNHVSLEPIWARLNALRAPAVEHPMHPANTDGLDEYELPIRVGFMHETTTALTRMIYGGVFERYPDFPYVVAHTGAALLMLMERLDSGYRIFPDCRKHITQLPSVYVRRLYFDTCAFAAEPSTAPPHSGGCARRNQELLRSRSVWNVT